MAAKDATLTDRHDAYLGIDVGKETHWAYALDSMGSVLLSPPKAEGGRRRSQGPCDSGTTQAFMRQDPSRNMSRRDPNTVSTGARSPEPAQGARGRGRKPHAKAYTIFLPNTAASSRSSPTRSSN